MSPIGTWRGWPFTRSEKSAAHVPDFSLHAIAIPHHDGGGLGERLCGAQREHSHQNGNEELFTHYVLQLNVSSESPLSDNATTLPPEFVKNTRFHWEIGILPA